MNCDGLLAAASVRRSRAEAVRLRLRVRLLSSYLSIVARTSTVAWHAEPDTAPCVWTCWHGDWLAVIVAFLAADTRPPTFIGLKDRRGEAIGAAYTQLGGSSIRARDPRAPDGQASALSEIVRCLRSGRACLITPDGPYGPRGVEKPGARRAAAEAGVTRIPLGIVARRRLVLPRWDRFIVPLPYARIIVTSQETRR
jgi:lysophospholipid acyltransferase (LPLAT)-like uncharacterized protein